MAVCLSMAKEADQGSQATVCLGTSKKEAEAKAAKQQAETEKEREDRRLQDAQAKAAM